jgi:hypothetical protein
MRRMMLFMFSLMLLFAFATFAATAQTVTYEGTIPQTRCGPGGPEYCTYYPPGINRFQTGDPWTQLDFIPATHADYCTSFPNYTTTAVWTISDTDQTPPPLPEPVYPVLSYSNQSGVKLFTLTCVATAINSNLHPTVNAEIFAFSYTKTFRCGSRSPSICHTTNWQTIDGSFVQEISQ